MNWFLGDFPYGSGFGCCVYVVVSGWNCWEIPNSCMRLDGISLSCQGFLDNW